MNTLDFGITELEELDTPGFWSWAAGCAVGAGAGGLAWWLGTAIAAT